MAGRQLFVLRHAKSSWDDPAIDDHERPLAPRGLRAAQVLRQHLERHGISPGLVLCSSARRTRETLAGIQPDGEQVIEPELYGASAGALIERLRRIPEEVTSVMLIGHNPAVQVLVLRLAEAGGATEEVRRKFPTGGMATLELDCTWGELAPGRARLTGFIRPKQLVAG
jgi:phosphohistidine phosphatase